MSNSSIAVAINSNGSVTRGDTELVGCTRVSTGHYRVTFNDNVFDAPPIVVITVDTSTEKQPYVACAVVVNVESNSMDVYIQSTGGSASNKNLGFDMVAYASN